MRQNFVGSQLCTTAAGQAVGVSGRKTRVFFAHIISGATAGIIKLYNGTSTGGTIILQQTCGTVSTGNDFDYGEYGVLFPNGCFYEEVVDANVTSTLITFEQEA